MLHTYSMVKLEGRTGQIVLEVVYLRRRIVKGRKTVLKHGLPLFFFSVFFCT